MHEAKLRYLYSSPFGLFTISVLLWCFLFPVAKAPANVAAVLVTTTAVFGICSLKIPTPAALKSRTTIAVALLMSMPLLWYGHPGPGQYGAYAKDALFALYMLALICWISLYPHRICHAIYALLLGTVFTSIISLLQKCSVIPFKEAGVALGLLNGTLTGAFSLLLAFSCAILSYLIRYSVQKRTQLLLLLGLLICLTDLILVVPGRTGYLTFIVVAGFIFYNLYKTNTVLVVGCLLILVLFVMNSSVFWSRVTAVRSNLNQYSHGYAATSLGERFEMWKVSWRIFSEHPLFGAGPNGFSKHWMEEGYKKVPRFYNNPHSTYFHILGNYGLVGFGILLYFLWRIAITSWQHRNTLIGVTVGCFLVVFVVGSLTNTMVTSDFYLTWLAIMGGLAGGLPDFSGAMFQENKCSPNQEPITAFEA